jgi:formylglycine-generating enzyme required for sulfatase activity
MATVFISYRRADSVTISGRIYDRLRAEFGKDAIFKDVDNIPPGMDFRGVLNEATTQCTVMLVIIGQKWVNVDDGQGNRRLDNPNDFVRIEVETGLQHDSVRVIPVLVGGAGMPSTDDLPGSLQQLAFKNAVPVRDDPDFHRDMDRLVTAIRPLIATPTPAVTPKPTPARGKINPTIVVALITGIFAVIAALIGIVPPLLEQNRDAAVTQSAENTFIAQTQTISADATAVALAASNTPAISPTTTSAPSDTPPPPVTATPAALEAALAAASQVMTDNSQWQDMYPAGFVATFDDDVPMVLVPAGCFVMGSTAEQIDLALQMGANEDTIVDEHSPSGEVCFEAPFWLDQYEVTNAQFQQYGGDVERSSEGTQAMQPRNQISWFEARNFCENNRPGSVRLPTEAEWEFAARGPSNNLFPWGSQFINGNAAFRGNVSGTVPVGSYPAGKSWVGAEDMSGNVWEWVSSLYRTYPYDASDGREDLNVEDSRVLRGGSWQNQDHSLRGASREWDGPSFFSAFFGFRCARDS